MDAYEWLGVWEPIEAPGKHTKRIPAGFAHGYRYGFAPDRIDRRPRMAERRSTMWDRVGRAIVVDGTVTDAPPSWTKSPQARFWLGEEKAGLAERIRRWMRRGCGCPR